MSKNIKNYTYCSQRFLLGALQYTSIARNQNRIIILGTSDGDFEVLSETMDPVSYSAHDDAIFVVVFNHDGTLFATGCRDNSAKVWAISDDGKTISCVATLDASQYGVSSLAFNCDSTLLVAGGPSDEIATVWKISHDVDGQIVVSHATNITEELGNYIYSIGFHPNIPNIVATGSGNGTIKLWDLSNETPVCINTLIGHTFCVSSLAFLQDGTGLVSGSYDGTVKIWKRINDEPSVQTIGTLNDGLPYDATVRVNTVAIDHRTNVFALGKSNGIIEFWNLSSDGTISKLIRTIQGTNETIQCVSFSFGTFLLLGDREIQIIPQ
jgi:WD40 repeat protein